MGTATRSSGIVGLAATTGIPDNQEIKRAKEGRKERRKRKRKRRRGKTKGKMMKGRWDGSPEAYCLSARAMMSLGRRMRFLMMS